jgi:hypothetical protein
MKRRVSRVQTAVESGDLSAAAFTTSLGSGFCRGGELMGRILATAAVLASLAFSPACAEERAGNAALGALSGAVVLGPVGAVAGAVVGYTAGPSIARSWGLSRPAPRRPRRVSRPPAKQATQAAAVARPAASGAGEVPSPPRRPAQSAGARGAVPPMQGFD